MEINPFDKRAIIQNNSSPDVLSLLSTAEKKIQALLSDPKARDEINQNNLLTEAYETVKAAHKQAQVDATARFTEPDREQLEQALRECKITLTSVLESRNILAGIAELSGEDILYVLVNQRLADFFGFRSEEVAGKTAKELGMDEETITRWKHNFQQCIETGEPVSIEYPLTYQETSGWYYATINQIPSGPYQNPRFSAVIVDLTEQKATEQALRENQALLDSILENATTAVFAKDLEGKFLLSNRHHAELLGAKPEDVIGKTDLDFETAAPRYEEYQANDRRVIEQGRPIRFEEIAPGLDGKERTYLAVKFPIRSADGRVSGVCGISTDITENKQIEKALRESEQKHRELVAALEVERGKLAAVIENLPVGVGVVDVQGNILSLNSAGMKMHGFQSESECFRTLAAYETGFEMRSLDGSLLPVDEWPASRVFRGENVKDFQVRLYNKRSSIERIVSFSIMPIYNPDGEMILIVYVIEDLTERKQAEQALRSSEERFRLAARATNDAIWDWDLTTDAIQWNEALTDLFGYPPEIQSDSSGSWWKSRIHPEDYAEVIASLDEVIHGEGDVWITEYRFQRVDGSYAEVEDRGWVVRDGCGHPLRMMGAIKDVTIQDKAERALRESEERFRAMADGTPVIIWVTDAAGNIAFVNRAYREFFGVTLADIQASGWQVMVHPDDSVGYVDVYMNCLKEGRPFRAEARVRRHDGQWRWIDSQGQPRFSGSNEFLGMAGSSLDITDRKLAERELWSLNQELEQRVAIRTDELLELQRRLIDGIEAERVQLAREIHDGPMQDIYALVYRLAGAALDRSAGKTTEELDSLQEGLIQINQSLRSISQDLLPPTLSEFGLDKSIRAHIENISQANPELKILLDLQSDGKLLDDGTRLALFRIYQTSIANVMRHAEAKHVTVRFYEDAEGCILDIQDDGVGFEVPQSWIELARQGHMGLVSAQERAQSIGGKLEVQSYPGSGTQLRVVVPRG